MKKIILSVLLFAMTTVALMAQNNSRINYQMVVRNNANDLVLSQNNIPVTISLLDGPDGQVFYSEQQAVSTNANGIASFHIGGGMRLTGDFYAVAWERAYVKVDLKLAGEGWQSSLYPLTTSPAAFYAEQVDTLFLTRALADAAYLDSAAVLEITNALRDSFPANISAFVNDVPYLTSYAESQTLSIAGDTLFLADTNYVVLPKRFSGNYADLTNRPALPDSISQLVNDLLFATAAAIPDTVSAFVNDAGYITAADLATLMYQLPALRQNLNEMSALADNLRQYIAYLNRRIAAVKATIE